MDPHGGWVSGNLCLCPGGPEMYFELQPGDTMIDVVISNHSRGGLLVERGHGEWWLRSDVGDGDTCFFLCIDHWLDDIAAAQKDLATYQANKTKEFEATIHGKLYTGREEVKAALDALPTPADNAMVTVGSYRGLPITARRVAGGNSASGPS